MTESLNRANEERRQLRECLRDFVAMVEAETAYVRTGKHRGRPMRDVIGQWESLCRDATNILNREDNSYGKATKS